LHPGSEEICTLLFCSHLQAVALTDCLKDIDLFSEYIELCGQNENRVDSAGGRHRAESVIIVFDIVFAFSAHVLSLYNTPYNC